MINVALRACRYVADDMGGPRVLDIMQFAEVRWRKKKKKKNRQQLITIENLRRFLVLIVFALGPSI